MINEVLPQSESHEPENTINANVFQLWFPRSDPVLTTSSEEVPYYFLTETRKYDPNPEVIQLLLTKYPVFITQTLTFEIIR